MQDLFRYSQLPPVPENPIEIESESEDEPVEAVAVAFGPSNRAEKLPPIHYSQIDGDPCHQCRRKSNKPKMSCRNKDPQCNNKYCISCVQRYVRVSAMISNRELYSQDAYRTDTISPSRNTAEPSSVLAAKVIVTAVPVFGQADYSNSSNWMRTRTSSECLSTQPRLRPTFRSTSR